MARLVLQTPEGQRVIELRPVNSLGRHPSNSIQLLDKIVSKEHCIIEQRGMKFVLRDLGSLNGTFINRERVHGEAPLKDADEIALGATRARFEEGPAVGGELLEPVASTARAQPPASPPAPQAWPDPAAAAASWPQPELQPQPYARQIPPPTSGRARPPNASQQMAAVAPAGTPTRPVGPPMPPPASQRRPVPSARGSGPGAAGQPGQGPPRPPPPPMRTPAKGFSTAYLPQMLARATN